MPRRARLIVQGIPWHIIQRGNNRSACFYSEDDYRKYLDVLKEQAEKYDCLVHAYCLMTNHVHLLLTPMHENSASLMMKHLGQRYVQYINRTYKRSGTLWEGRFRSCLTQSEEYVLSCYRFNGQGEKSELITPHEQYHRSGLTDVMCRKNYRGLFDAHMEPGLIDEIRNSTNGNYVLGNERFKEEIASMLKRRVSPGKAGRPMKESVN